MLHLPCTLAYGLDIFQLKSESSSLTAAAVDGAEVEALRMRVRELQMELANAEYKTQVAARMQRRGLCCSTRAPTVSDVIRLSLPRV